MSVISEHNFPVCPANKKATRIEMRVQFASHDTIPIILGEKEIHQKERVTKIYPNPIANEFTIAFGKVFSGSVSIFLPTGEKVSTFF